jgi:L-2-hydroxyglutarate oxidase LhgO
MNFDFGSIVIGAGVVGLAIARDLAISGRKVLLLERCKGVGQGVSSRNSEVIHAGIYYSIEPVVVSSKDNSGPDFSI